MQSSDENWDTGAFEDLFAWIRRALERYAGDRDCRHCLRLAREGLEQLRTTPGGAPRNAAADLLRAQMHARCLDLEQGRRDWSAEGVEALLGDLRQLRALLDAGEAMAAASGSGVMPLGGLLRRVPGDRDRPAPEPRPVPGVVVERSPDPAASGADTGTGERRAHEELQHARRAFQRVLVELMYDRDLPQSFGHLAEVSAGIAEALPGTGCAALFRAVEDLGQRHALAAIPASDDLKILLGRVDRQLGQCLRESGAAAAGGAPEAFSVEPALLDPLLQALREALQDLPDTATPGRPETVSGDRGPVPNPPSDEAMEDFDDFPVPDETRLERMRSQGQAEMARLARAFAALEGAPFPEAAVPDSAGTPAGASTDPDAEAVRARVDEVASWQQRAVEALAQAAREVQGLENLLDVNASEPMASAPDPSAGDRAANAMPSDLVERLEQATRAFSASVGDASTALLRQRRAVEELRDLLFGPGSQSRSP
jgi:hypothetical protein